MIEWYRGRRALLMTVSAAALVITVETAGVADEPNPAKKRWWVRGEGQFTFWNDDFDSDEAGVDVGLEDGWSGRLSAGTYLSRSGPWFFEGSAEFNRANSESYSGGEYGAVSIENDEKIDVIDLVIGRDIGVGDRHQLRVFGGARFADFNTQTDGAYYGGTQNQTRSFVGAGPRVGADGRFMLRDRIMLDGGASGSVLFGRRENSYSASYGGYGGYSGGESESGTATNIEGSLALTYLLGRHAEVSAGYRVAQWWNTVPSLDGESDEDRLLHGPFLRLTVGGD